MKLSRAIAESALIVSASMSAIADGPRRDVRVVLVPLENPPIEGVESARHAFASVPCLA